MKAEERILLRVFHLGEFSMQPACQELATEVNKTSPINFFILKVPWNCYNSLIATKTRCRDSGPTFYSFWGSWAILFSALLNCTSWQLGLPHPALSFSSTIWLSFSTTAFSRFLFPFPTNQPLWKKDETKMKNSNGSALTYKIAPRTLKTFTRYVLSSFTLSNLELEKLHCQKQNAPTEKIKKKKKEIESRN